jgi:hypothetical protein
MDDDEINFLRPVGFGNLTGLALSERKPELNRIPTVQECDARMFNSSNWPT